MQRAPQPPSHNLTRLSQIYFFAEPNAEGFAGFGVPTAFDKPNHLLGLWRIGGDKKEINNWLSRIEATFGACPTIRLPGHDGSWLLTQLHIEPNSHARLERCAHPLAAALHRLLTPMLAVAPAPILAVQWDQARQHWQHDLWAGLPPEAQSMLTGGTSCIPVERRDGALGFATVQDLSRSVSTGYCSLVYDWQLWPASGGPIASLRWRIRPQLFQQAAKFASDAGRA